MQEVDNVTRSNRIMNMIESIVFENHQEIQDKKHKLSVALSEEFKKRNNFKSISREGSREQSRENSKERSNEKKENTQERSREEPRPKEEIQSRNVEEKNEEKNNKNSNIVVNLNSSSRGRSPTRGTSRGFSQRSTFGGRNYYNPSEENLYDDDFGQDEIGSN